MAAPCARTRTKHRAQHTREGRASGRAEHAGAHRSGRPSGAWGALWSGDFPDPTSMLGRTAAATSGDSGTCSGLLDQAGLTRGRHSIGDLTVVERGTVERWSAVPTRQGLARAWHSTRTGVAALTALAGARGHAQPGVARAQLSSGRLTVDARGRLADGGLDMAESLGQAVRGDRVQSAQVGWEPTLTWSVGLRWRLKGEGQVFQSLGQDSRTESR